MKDERANSTNALTAVLGRVGIAFCLGLLFTLTCFVLLQWSESFLTQNAVRPLTRIIWWPVAVTCGLDSRDLLCALPGIIPGFLFHWLVAFGLLWIRLFGQIRKTRNSCYPPLQFSLTSTLDGHIVPASRPRNSR